jgi:hypothetical protein
LLIVVDEMMNLSKNTNVGAFWELTKLTIYLSGVVEVKIVLELVNYVNLYETGNDANSLIIATRHAMFTKSTNLTFIHFMQDFVL